MSFFDAWDAAEGRQPHGAALLDQLHHELTTYVVFPRPEAADAAALFTVATHAQPAWEHATRLVIKSPERRCGKTRLMEIVREVAHRPVSAVNISAAALVRSITADDPPTICVDEADRMYRSVNKSEVNEDLTAILNVGFARDWPYIRYNVSRNAAEDWPTFGMAVLTTKGVDLPDTVEDRAIVIMLKRRAPGETVAEFRRRRDVPRLRQLREAIGAWIAGRLDTLDGAEPDVPAEDRAREVWEPLVAVADAAGGHWPARARAACKTLTAEADQADRQASDGVRLLADVHDVFTDMTVSFLESRELVSRLRHIDDTPWRDYDLTASGLASRLRGYDVAPRRNGTRTARGYYREDFADAFRRYLSSEDTPSEDVRVSEPQVTTVDTPDDRTGQGVRVSGAAEPLTSESDDRTGSDTHPADTWSTDTIGAHENREDRS